MDTGYRSGNGGTAAGSIGNMAKAIGVPVDRPTVQQALDEQEKCMHHLFSALNALEERLALVLQSVPSDPNVSSGTPTPPQIYDRVHTTTRGIQQATNWIESLAGRLQL